MIASFVFHHPASFLRRSLAKSNFGVRVVPFRHNSSIIGRQSCCKRPRDRIYLSTSSSSTTTHGPSTILKVLEFPASDKHEDGDDKKRATVFLHESGSWKKVSKSKDGSILAAASSFSHTAGLTRNLQSAVYYNVIRHFLPAQYPHSVAKGYTEYIVFSFGAGVAGSAAMVLSTQTLLLAVGVVGSSQQASVMAGALNWVIKDGIGQLGGVLFASQMGRSNRFDANPKQWKMISALSLDIANFCEIMSPLLAATNLVLPLACVANVGKNIGFLTASASRAALHQSLAIQGTLADVTAKAGSQSLVAGLLGTSLGIGVSSFLAHDVSNFIMGFAVLSFFHQTCTYMSLRAVPLLHMNRHRMHFVLTQYLSQDDMTMVASPADVAAQETYIPFLQEDDSHTWLSIGSALNTFCSTPQDFERLRTICSSEAYMVNLVDGRVHLVFLDEAAGPDVLMGMLHAHTIHHSGSEADTTTTAANCNFDTIADTYNIAKENFPMLLQGLQGKGWKIESGSTIVESGSARRFSIVKE